ncbi:MAG: hypothetical protein II004_06180 [Erysipelotrichaceae bacterium]|nr:hypothetical protein [Erysipelotrichaceae bacterium]
MILRYDPDDLRNRKKTELKDENDHTVFWGIYDFAFKYRTRIFDGKDNELGYVQLDVGKAVPEVVFCDAFDETKGQMVREEDHYQILPEGMEFHGDSSKGEIPGIMKIRNGELEIDKTDDPLLCVMILYASVEIVRGEEI